MARKNGFFIGLRRFSAESRLRFLSIIFILCLPTVLLSGCEKEEVIQIDVTSSIEFQQSMYESIASRKQVTGLLFDDDNYRLLLGNNQEFVILRDKIPLITISGNMHWIINGRTTGCIVEKDASNSVVLPIISCGDNGDWFIDNWDTKVKVDNDYYQIIREEKCCIFAIVHIDSYLFCYTIGDGVIRVPVVSDPFYHIPKYFENQIVEKEFKAEAVIEKADGNQVSFVFFTDAHWGRNRRHSPSLIKHIVDYTPLEYVFFGGDAITNNYDDPKDALELGFEFQRSFSFLESDFYCVVGNHDDNATGQASAIEKHLSDEQVYSYLQSQMKDVTYGPYFNFYFDDEDSKTRFLCLDTGRLYLSENRSFTSQTAKYVVDVLATVPSGWHVIAISHIWNNLVYIKTGECKESSYVKPIIDLLEDYNNRKAGLFQYGKVAFDYDFSLAGGRVEFCLGGHTHADSVVMSDGGIPLITITSDGQIEVAGEPSISGTVSEQCVGLFVTDYSDRKLYVFHIGRGNDMVLEI